MAGYSTPAWTNNASPAIDATALSDLGQAVEIAEHPYGVCSSGSSAAAKSVTVDYSGILSLFTGIKVRVKFTNANTAASPTLNVNGTGDIPIVVYAGSAVAGTWVAGSVVDLVYDGTNWVIINAAIASTPNSANVASLITSAAVATALAGKAPSGYGIGENDCYILTSSDDIKYFPKGGFFRWASGSIPKDGNGNPAAAGAGCLINIPSTATHSLAQILFDFVGNVIKARFYSGGWSNWKTL